MTDLELIKQIDAVIEQYTKYWAEDLKKLYDKYGDKLETEKGEKPLKKLTKKYSPIFADLLFEREDVYNRIVAASEAEFMDEFKPKVDQEKVGASKPQIKTMQQISDEIYQKITPKDGEE